MVLAFTDMQGRLQGKRLHAATSWTWRSSTGTEGCNYLLAVDIDMNTVAGYAISSWESGYGDMEFVPDWRHPAAAPPPAGHGDGAVRPGLARPRAGAPVAADDAAHQLDRAAEQGMVALSGTELEFIAFDASYEDAPRLRYRDLHAVNQYNVDYSILGTTRVEPLLRDIRNHMYAAGLDVEGAKGECNFGQHEIGFLYADAMVTADNHSVYKTAAKEIAAQQRQGDHVHGQVQRARGHLLPHPPVAARRRRQRRLLGRRSAHAPLRLVHRRRAGHAARLHPALRTERQLLQAVRPRVVRPDRRRLGHGQPHLRGPSGRPRPSARMENRLPGATSTPTSRSRRCSPVACTGSRTSSTLEDELVGNAYDSDKPHVPQTLHEARDLFAASAVARAAFGDEVVDHYVNMADVELAAFDAAVTDWELARSFERM